MARLLILKTGNSFPEVVAESGDFEACFQRRLTRPDLDIQVVDAVNQPSLPDIAFLDGIVITGSHAMVTDAEPWSERLKPWLRDAVGADLPMLGVCYGHQLLGEALGGRCDDSLHGPEVGTFEITLSEAGRGDPLFGRLPPRFMAHLTHSQALTVCPTGATVLAGNSHEPYQALRFGIRQWGVQFHPEFDERVMRRYLAHQEARLRDVGRHPDVLLADVQETPQASRLLATFASLVVESAR